MKSTTLFMFILVIGIGITAALDACDEPRTCVRCGTEFVIDWDLAKKLDSLRADSLNVPYDQELQNRPGGKDTARMVGLYCVDAGYTDLTPEAINAKVTENNRNPIRVAFLRTQCTEPGTVKETKEFQWRDPIE